jgi:hypothetical protein
MVNITFRQRGNEGVPKRIARPFHENSFDYFRWSIDNNFVKWMKAFEVEVVKLLHKQKNEKFSFL